MIAAEATIDVFLSFSMSETEAAAWVADALSQVGFRVATPEAVSGNAKADDDLWWSLVQCDAMVVLAGPSQSPSANSLVQLGAAMAWHKPIFVLQKDLTGSLEPPLGSFPAFSLGRLDDLAATIRRTTEKSARKESLSDEQRLVLSQLYTKVGMPLDRLLGDPESLDLVTEAFNHRSRTSYSTERLANELLRMRKSRRLPSLKRA